MHKLIKSPLNYIGGKYQILPQILPLFPEKTRCFVDLFAGGANVGINANADVIILNDNLVYLIDIYEELLFRTTEEVLGYIDETINELGLSLVNREGYDRLRSRYNAQRNPLDLLMLTFFSFNHQLRFNNNHMFNAPFGRNRSHYNVNIQKNLIEFMRALHSKNIKLTKCNFTDFDFSCLGALDFVYCDPPYLITTGTYNDGRRGFSGWGEELEKKLLAILDELDARGVKFALSNVTVSRGKENNVLISWLNESNYQVYSIDKDYKNSNYHRKSCDATCDTREVLITNY